MMENAQHQMVMSQTPDGVIRITVAGPLHRDPLSRQDPQGFATMFGASSDAISELVPQTQAAFADFVQRHGGRPAYPSLAQYPQASRA